MKLISTGNQDFKDIRNEDAFYVDKTELIEDIITSSKTKVFLFTRPRRFGKSLNLSMIDAFFNVKYGGNTWFDGLHVEKCEACRELKNRFPVISIDFKTSRMGDKNTFLGLFSETISKVYRDFPYLENSSELSAVQKEMYSLIVRRKANEVELMKSLANLSELLFCHHGVPAIILIDEYDNPIQNYHGTRMGDYVLNFVRELMGSALKGNQYLKFAVVSGVLQIAKESLFSGLNNLYVNNIFSKEFDERYGFTSAEVKQICDDFGHPEKFSECKEWYDGYRFGNAEIYNPWSVLSYVQNHFEPGPYWTNTGSTELLKEIIRKADRKILDGLTNMSKGKTVRSTITPTVTYANLESSDNSVYSLLSMAGYFNAVPSGPIYELSIPNKEMADIFGNLLLESLYGGESGWVLDFCDAVLKNDLPRMQEDLFTMISMAFDAKVFSSEHTYQTFVTGMLLTLYGKYQITADFRGGEGYYDIRMESNFPSSPHVVMELKKCRANSKDETCQKNADDALAQIHDKKYYQGLKGTTILYGLAFRNGRVFGKSEIAEL